MLNDPQRLSAVNRAKVTLTINNGCACLCVKDPDGEIEMIHDRPAFGSPTTLETIVAQILTRFSIETHTQTEFIRLAKQRSAKLTGILALPTEICELKRDMLMPIEELEPCLASPRSSPNHQLMEATYD